MSRLATAMTKLHKASQETRNEIAYTRQLMGDLARQRAELQTAENRLIIAISDLSLNNRNHQNDGHIAAGLTQLGDVRKRLGDVETSIIVLSSDLDSFREKVEQIFQEMRQLFINGAGEEEQRRVQESAAATTTSTQTLQFVLPIADGSVFDSTASRSTPTSNEGNTGENDNAQHREPTG